MAPARASGANVLLPLPFTAALALLVLLPAVREVPSLPWSFLGAVAALAVWNAVLAVRARRRGRRLLLEIALRPQHYLQACAHLSIYAYWGWYWPTVYQSAHLIVAQLLFAYAFDMLLAWSRRDVYALGFGPFPIILSTNLFLWFKPECFYLQFLLVSVGLLAKELIRWQRDGRSVHVFNPSSFPLALFSLGILITGTGDHTYAREIATTLFRPPHIYIWIFLVGLPGQFLFGVTTMTLSAVVTTYAVSALYFALTGSYFFFDSYIPIAVFLGMHLLFTDPSTSPRTELGRIFFGVLYGAAVAFLYWLLGALGVDTFYDKLLPVPLLNLGVRAFDRLARAPSLRRIDPARLGTQLAPRRRNFAYMTVWALTFVVLSFRHGLADTHPGNRLPFWQQACKEGRRNACRNLAMMESTYCRRGIGWACNELGILVADRAVVSETGADELFTRSCDDGFGTGCANAVAVTRGQGALRHAPPLSSDYDQMLETKGFPAADSALQTMLNACDQGWSDACGALGGMYLTGNGAARDLVEAARAFERACAGGVATSCSDLGLMYRRGDGVMRDDARALGLLERACTLGMENACRWRAEEARRAP